MTPDHVEKLRAYGQAWLEAEEAQHVANEKRMTVARLADHSLREVIRMERPIPSLVMPDGVVLTFRYTGSRDNPIEVTKTKLVSGES